MSDRFLLWGFKRSFCRRWVKLAGGTLRGCRQEMIERQECGWRTALFKPALQPGLHPEQNNHIPNAHVWTRYECSDVKLTLRYGESIDTYHRAKTEEGWSGHGERLTHVGDRIICEWIDEGRDCDGYFRQDGQCNCRIDQLNSLPPDEYCPDHPRTPWQATRDIEVLDEFAVEAGY